MNDNSELIVSFREKIQFNRIDLLKFYINSIKSFIGLGILIIPFSIKNSNYFINFIISVLVLFVY